MTVKRLLQSIVHRLATFGIKLDERPDGNQLFKDFIGLVEAMNAPTVLELGVKRSIPSRSTLHKHWVPKAGAFLGTDIEAGEDVDFVADIHRLTEVTGEEKFDVVISCSTFEHFKYPQKAAHEIMKSLRMGGAVFIQTHQSLPIHDFPYDYFRFSREGLAALFGQEMGFEVLGTDYEYPVRLFSVNDKAGHFSPSYLNTRLLGVKTGRTPEDYIYEYDTE